MPDRLIFLEFADEADAYLDQFKQESSRSPGSQFISLDPKVQVHLAARDVQSVNTRCYFDSNSHARALRKSHELLDWIASRFKVVDPLGLEKTYSQALLWYSRYTLHHLIWLSEILSLAAAKHPNAMFVATLRSTDGNGSPMIQPNERYLGHLAKQLSIHRGTPFQTIDTQSSQVTESPQGTSLVLIA